MQKVLSLKNGRLYFLSENKLVTCDEESPALSEVPDYSICENLGLICEECRQPVFFAQEGIRAGGEDKLEPIIVNAHFRHYAAKDTQFCSQRAQSAEGRKAYQQVLHPIARGQWLSRFKSCFLHAILIDPTESFFDKYELLTSDGTIDLEVLSPPKFTKLRPIGPKLKEAHADNKRFLSAIISAMQDEGRKEVHDRIDSALAFLEHSVSVVKEEDRSPATVAAYHLANSCPGGMIAHQHCAHLAADFITAESQSDMLKIFMIHCLGSLEEANRPSVDKIHYFMTKSNRMLGREEAEERMMDIFDEVLADIFNVVSLFISKVPWQYAWPYAVEEGKRKPLIKRLTTTRAKGFQ